MDDRTRIWTGALAGAIAGAAFAYLYFTDRGRRVREDLEPRLEQFVAEIDRTRASAVRARRAVGESWRTVRRVETDRRREAGHSRAGLS